MRGHFLIIKALLAAVCVFGAASVPAADYSFTKWREQFSRWKSRPTQDSSHRMVSGGPYADSHYLSGPRRSDALHRRAA